MRSLISQVIILLAIIGIVSCKEKTNSVIIEAENFSEWGSWVIDQQSIDQIGSSYLLAHGLGNPCKDAITELTFPVTGIYHVWVRTRNWAPAPVRKQCPGRFQLIVNNEPLDTIFGQDMEDWNWHYGGRVHIGKLKTEIKLHDLTGFEGRCDAIIFSTDESLIPHQSGESLIGLRKEIRKAPEDPVDSGDYDLVVVGGGVAGICTSVTAARLGLKVALIQNRPVLGGNNSSEIRIPMASDLNILPYPNLGNITRELDSANVDRTYDFGGTSDDNKLKFIQKESNISVFLGMHVIRAETSKNRIDHIVAMDIRTNKEYSFHGKLFADCTGDGNLGFITDADYRYGRESKAETGEAYAPENPDSLVLGATLHWLTEKEPVPVRFPECPWALAITEESCQDASGGAWNWETGFESDMVNETENIRDHMFRAIYGNWAFQKNNYSQKDKYKNHTLIWVGHILGKRESRRLLGDVIYSQHDIEDGTAYPDACVSTHWGIDLHYPNPENSRFFPGEEFRSIAHHELKNIHPLRSLPYRCFYSRNIENLFMAGRCVSMTHVAHAMFRNQHTTGMMGEVVGMAASLCIKNNTIPEKVYTEHWDEMKNILNKGVGK